MDWTKYHSPTNWISKGSNGPCLMEALLKLKFDQRLDQYRNCTMDARTGPKIPDKTSLHSNSSSNIECRTNQDSVLSSQCTFRISKPGNGKHFYLTHVLFSSNFTFWNSNTFKLCPKLFPVRRFDHSVAHRRTSKRLIARCVYKCEMREYFNWINMHLGHVTRIPIYFIGL